MCSKMELLLMAHISDSALRNNALIDSTFPPIII